MVVIIIGLPIYLATKLLDAVGWGTPLVAVILVIALVQ